MEKEGSTTEAYLEFFVHGSDKKKAAIHWFKRWF